tara:strand:+ start:355 stop:678 length:324 start_codon:yes stop_codon:yes gene_type:complete
MLIRKMTSTLRLEPEYITKYGVDYHTVYHNYYKKISCTREEHYQKYRKKFFLPTWDNTQNTEIGKDIMYIDYDVYEEPFEDENIEMIESEYDSDSTDNDSYSEEDFE